MKVAWDYPCLVDFALASFDKVAKRVFGGRIDGGFLVLGKQLFPDCVGPFRRPARDRLRQRFEILTG